MQTVHVRVNDAETGMPTPCRVRFEGLDGTAYAPFGRVADSRVAYKLNEFEGNVAPLGDDLQRFAVIDGSCEIDLPPGPITVWISKGFEYRPVREIVMLAPGQLALRFVLRRFAELRAEGWFSGDIACFEMTPHDALLEGSAEDLAVVNLLVSEEIDPVLPRRRPLFRNITAFSGQQPCLSRPGHEVVVNTINRHIPLGRVCLLNCHRVVYPLSAGLTDGSRWALADWCDQCHRKGGLVVMPPPSGLPQDQHRTEMLVDIVLGYTDAVWYEEFSLLMNDSSYLTLLRAGVRLPLVCGSGKSHDFSLLGTPRTYARLPASEAYSYRGWIEAVRAGRVFVTTGPLLSVTVDGTDPGSVIDLPGPGRVHVVVTVRSIRPITRIEVVANGNQVGTVPARGTEASGEFEVDLPEGGWVIARAIAEADGEVVDVAMSSPVWVAVNGKYAPRDPAAVAKLDGQLAQTAAWLDDPATTMNERLRERLKEMVARARGVLVGE